MKWTDEQKRTIDLRDSNILVSAAAGSGKTAVLVERIISLVKDGNEDIDKFLVVTFTKAAAAGMRQKIQKELVKASRNGENSRHIRRQLSLLNKAHITTIHSFCMDVVKSNFHVLDLDPSFRVGDTSELGILLQESIGEVLEKAYSEENEDFILLTESFGENRGDTQLCKIIEDLYRFILSFPDPFKWLKSSAEMIGMNEEEFKRSSWNKEILDYMEMQLDGARSLVELAIEISEEIEGPEPYILTLNEDLILITEIKVALKEDLMTAINAIHNYKAPRLNAIKKVEKEFIDVEKQDEVKDLRDEYKSIVKELQNILPYKTIHEYIRDVNHMHCPIKALEKIVIELDELYKEKKRAQSIVDFNDLEHYALKILRDDSANTPSDIGDSYRAELKYIFIDEYQDSNSLQEAIIEQIKRDDNLFMVGDVKQSIYRFRLADPSIFNRKYENYEKDHEELEDDVINRVVELNKNFRSRAEILNFTNYIFQKIMTVGLGEIDYNEDIFLKCGNEGFKNNSPVELNIIDKGMYSEKEDLNDELKAMENAEIEALFAVKRIKELLNDEIYDLEEENNLRKIEYKDIVILSRAVSSIGSVYEEVFNREEIPFYLEGGTGYFETIEIQVMINLLKLIDNIRQDIPIISVMRSKIGNFSTEELIEIRIRYPKDNYIEACEKYSDREVCEGELSEELAAKLDSFFQKIEEWEDRTKYTALHEIIWEILIETGYYNFVGTLADGKTRQANLRLLSDKAYEFENTSTKGLFKFLRYIEKLSDGDLDSSSSAKVLGENENVVRLMTVHGSKGLEFPVVILAGLNKMFNLQDTRSKILMHKDYGIAPKYINIDDRIEKDTIARVAISKKIKFENLSEEMRVLYVAMTRAVDKLIMFGSVNKLDTSFKKWRKGYSKYFLYKGSSYMDWICSCLFLGMSREDIEDVIGNGKCGELDIYKITTADLLNDIVVKEDNNAVEKIHKLLEGINPDEYREVDRRLGYKYPYVESIDLPAKLSVTAVNNLNRDRFNRLRYNIPELSDLLQFDKDNKIVLPEEQFKGAEIGTLIHLVMERIDISRRLDRDDLKSQLDDMRSKKLLTDSQSRYINRNYLDKIESYYKSNIGVRMKKSDVVKREAPFVIKRRADEILDSLNKDDFVLVQGIIDCYFEEDGEIVIIDYKTDSIGDNNIERLKAEYRDQIAFYKYAIEKTRGKRVKEAYLYLFSKGMSVLIK